MTGINASVLPVVGYEGLYSVTSDGRVFGEKSHKFLRQSKNKGGYMQVKLYKDAQPKSVKVHRIVAAAFLPNPSNKDQVNHKDGDKKNNSVGNLEWVTQSENQVHAYRNGLNTTVYAVNANKRKVVQLDREGHALKVWDSMSDAARATKTPVENITHCCRKRIKSAGGFVWEYFGF